VAAIGERWCALLESVLGASPREFESRILRHADQLRPSRLATASRAQPATGLNSGLTWDLWTVVPGAIEGISGYQPTCGRRFSAQIRSMQAVLRELGCRAARDPGIRDDERQPKTSETHVVWLITHRHIIANSYARSGSDRNRDGNTGHRQRPEAVINSRLLSHDAELTWASVTPEKQKVRGISVARITELTGCTVDTSLRLWTAEAFRPGQRLVFTVIHMSTVSLIHSCTAVDQPVCRKHPQLYAQDASLAPPGLA
jgi:hypothetical protein